MRKAERRVHNTAEIVADLRRLQRHAADLEFRKSIPTKNISNREVWEDMYGLYVRMFWEHRSMKS